MVPKQFALVFISAGVSVLAATGYSRSQPQQIPTPPAIISAQQPTRPQPPNLQEVDPPEPASKEGVNFSVRVIDGSTGQGLSGAEVELGRVVAAGVPVRGDVSNSVDRRHWVYKRSSDSQGVVQFTNVMPDRYNLSPPRLMGYAGSKPTDVAGPQLTPTNFNFTPGAKPDPVLFRMWKASFVDGFVEDGDGKAIPGTTVQILEEGWTGGLRILSLAQSVPTDATGKFVLEAVLPGTYYLRAIPPASLVQQQLKAPTKPNVKGSAFVDTLFPRAIYFENAAPLRIAAGVNVFGLHIEMQQSPYYSLSGRVSGVPEGIPNGLVLIRRVSFDSPFPFIWASPYAGGINIRLDKDGGFTAPNVPPGPYWAGYTPAGEVRGGAQFLIQDRDVDDFQFEVTKGVMLSGKLVYEDGSPVTAIPRNRMGVFLSNMGVYERNLFGPARSGDFIAGGLPVGTWRLDFLDPVVVRSVQVGARVFDGGKFELEADSQPVVITISRAGATIAGSVELQEQAKQFPRGMVTLTPFPFQPADYPKRQLLEGKTSFKFEHLEAGRYRVCAWVEEGAQVGALLGNPRHEQRFNAGCETVVVSRDETKQLQLRQMSTVDFQ
jgi:protocatechuate 3,4-dioxygenase beta subunit